MQYRCVLRVLCIQILLQVFPAQSACPTGNISTINECLGNPCVNGVCVDGYNRFICNCNAGYSGSTCDKTLPAVSGSTCEDVYKNILTATTTTKSTPLPEYNGPYSIQPSTESFRAYCDFASGCLQWTVMQRRSGCEVPFYRNWTEYKAGFGHPSGDYWLGLDRINQITTKNQRSVLRVELTDWTDVTCYEEYDNFKVGDESTKYTLTSVGTPTGTCGDSLSYQAGMKFSTLDQDNDLGSNENCAEKYKAAWWYNHCFHSNLNGQYVEGGNTMYGMCWLTGKGFEYAYKNAVMKIREF